MFDLTKAQNTDKSKESNSKPNLVAPSDREVNQFGRSQRREMVLPISQSRIVLGNQKLDPETLSVTKLNKRDQSILRLSDPDVLDLKHKIEKEGQLEPILVRFIDGKPEVVFGSRRRFVISAINKERKVKGEEPMLIDAWTHDNIPDVDARRLAASENDDKKPISPYEEGVYYKKMRDDENIEVDAIALIEGCSLTTVRDRLRIAEIDVEFVTMLSSAALITQQAGAKFVALINKTTIKKRESFIEEYKGFSYGSLKELVDDFKAFTQPKPKKVKVSEFKVGKKVKAKMTPNRDDKTKFKIDVFDMSEEQQEEMKALIESWIQ